MMLTKRFFKRWQNWVSLLLVVWFAGVAIAAPYLSPDDPKTPGPFKVTGDRRESSPLPPDEKSPLGVLPRGVDVYHAVVWGTRDALQFGLIIALSTAAFGTLYGAVAGVIGARASVIMMRASDAFLAIPPIAGLVFLQQLLGATIVALGGFYFVRPDIGLAVDYDGPTTLIMRMLELIDPLMLSLIALSWMPYARLVNSIVLTLRQTEFVQAARALGANPLWIVRKHLILNSVSPAIVLAARDVSGVVLLQATLTFIGLDGGSVWGAMLSQGRSWVIGPGGSLLTYWWVFLPPTFAVMGFGIAWNMFGDALSELFSIR